MSIPLPCPACSIDNSTIRELAEHLTNVHGWDWAEAWPTAVRAEPLARITALQERYPRMAEWTLETYPDDEAGRAARAKADRWNEATGKDAPRNLYLHGPVGCGKTGLAWAYLIAHIRESRLPGDFLNLRQHLAETKRKLSAGEKVDPLAPAVEDAWPGDGHLLVLDDIGAERPTPWAVEVIGAMVEERYLSDHCTIFTSNYSPAQLGRRLGHEDPLLGQRIISRILESCLVVEVAAPDRRLSDRPPLLLPLPEEEPGA